MTEKTSSRVFRNPTSAWWCRVYMWIDDSALQVHCFPGGVHFFPGPSIEALIAYWPYPELLALAEHSDHPEPVIDWLIENATTPEQLELVRVIQETLLGVQQP